MAQPDRNSRAAIAGREANGFMAVYDESVCQGLQWNWFFCV